MLQISKKVEYGLIAIRHMALQKNDCCTTTKEISERYAIPYNLLAKVMQVLARRGFIIPRQGVYGGYILTKNPSDIKISDVINAIEQVPQISLMQCEAEPIENCAVSSFCTIKSPLLKIQQTINNAFQQMSLQEILH
ncbi:MAG: Rrf2 family transcriptional regulator [Ignavibacteria bacterium]|nr:Rrf2 family transcriptional regulator [Ignavibacteria bacterium]